MTDAVKRLTDALANVPPDGEDAALCYENGEAIQCSGLFGFEAVTIDHVRALLSDYSDAVRDRDRLDFLINEMQFDSIGGLDVHEAVDAIARQMGRPVTVDEYPKLYMQAYRNIIDGARAEVGND